MFLLSMIKYPKFLGAGAAKDTRAINCVVSLPRLLSVCPGLRIIRCIPRTSEAAPSLSSDSHLLVLRNTGAGDAGPSADHRVTLRERQQNL